MVSINHSVFQEVVEVAKWASNLCMFDFDLHYRVLELAAVWLEDKGLLFMFTVDNIIFFIQIQIY